MRTMSCQRCSRMQCHRRCEPGKSIIRLLHLLHLMSMLLIITHPKSAYSTGCRVPSLDNWRRHAGKRMRNRNSDLWRMPSVRAFLWIEFIDAFPIQPLCSSRQRWCGCSRWVRLKERDISIERLSK